MASNVGKRLALDAGVLDQLADLEVDVFELGGHSLLKQATNALAKVHSDRTNATVDR